MEFTGGGHCFIYIEFDDLHAVQQETEVRPDVTLVARMVVTVGNYDYTWTGSSS
jgi:Cu2+-containing amine oxidase